MTEFILDLFLFQERRNSIEYGLDPQASQKTRMRLIDSLTQFADESSIHALNFIAKSPSKRARIIWFLLFTAALIYAGLQIAEEFNGENFLHISSCYELMNG